jgi:hypothetical protein
LSLAGEERDSDKRTMGVGQSLSSSIEKNFRFRTYTPLAGEERNSGEGRWGGLDDLGIMIIGKSRKTVAA